MKLFKNALFIAVLSTLIIGCGVKKEDPENAKDEAENPAMNQKVNEDVSALNASISQGVNQLKSMNDPNLSEIYNAINNLTADSTVNDLNAINTMVFNHLEALKSGQVVGQNTAMQQDDMSLVGQLAQAQQAAGNAKGGIEGFQENLNQLKALDNAKYQEVQGFIQKVDLNSLSNEDMKQLNNVVAKAVMDAKQQGN